MRPFQLLISTALILTSCTFAPATSDRAPSTSHPTTPVPSPLATETSTPFPNPVLKVTGEEEVVFDWTTDRCEDENIPDLAARAFRDSNNQVHLILSHYVTYRMSGTDLNSVTPDCSAPLMRSDRAADPSLYDDAEWIAAPYSEDGRTVYALVHNEYQGHQHPGYCPQNDYFPCWDNSITLAVSTDGGRTFGEAAPPPAHLVARLPYPYEAGAGPDGLRSPSNIIKGPDGFYYSFLNIVQMHTEEQWVCLMRTDDLADPAAWRFYVGDGFHGRFLDPYLDPQADPAGHLCPPLDIADIGWALNESITYNTYLNRYVLIGLSGDEIDGRAVLGVYYSFSDDLIQWDRRKLLKEMPLPWSVPNGGTDLSILYPSLLDPASDSRNFETSGKTAYLYYTRHNHGQGSLDRDLVRIAVEFFPEP